MQAHQYSPDFLTAEIQAHGLTFLVGREHAPAAPRLSSDELLASLARQRDARLRSALIPLFLQQPRLADMLSEAMVRLDANGQQTLKVYYTAAAILQDDWAAILRRHLPQWQPLPDIYSHELEVEQTADVNRRLHQLGTYHSRLSGLAINWPGTYRHATERFIRRLQREARWAA